MKIVNEHKLFKCSEKVVGAFREIVREVAMEDVDVIVVTSGAREDRYTQDGKRYQPSWHDEKHGFNAIDFYIKDANVFSYISSVYSMVKRNPNVTELEMCRGAVSGNIVQHIHIATGTEKIQEFFTGVYK